MFWRDSEPELFCAILLTSLHVLHVDGTAIVSQLPHLHALRVLSLIGTGYMTYGEGHVFAGPKDPDLAYQAPLLAELHLEVGSMYGPQ